MMTLDAGRVAYSLPGGDKVAALSSAEMREVDRIAVEEMGPALLQMMEHAGRSLAVLAIRAVRDVYPGGRTVILAGPGGNGGGGICAARHLAWRLDEVELVLSAPEADLSAAAAGQLALYRATGRDVLPSQELERRGPPNLVIDALLGYGLRGPPRGETERLIGWANGSGSRILALDLPSGTHPDTGDAPGARIRAAATLTLHMPKPGLRDPAAGRLYLADIGIPACVTGRIGVEPPSYGPAFIVPLERPATS
ncbi:MAG: NAD(P)H-hydrate epimerase [Gemmatimonadota bacterium]|nr:NAD(P)H-hydrate epimerase [Gemmatimonadota bacterium]